MLRPISDSPIKSIVHYQTSLPAIQKKRAETESQRNASLEQALALEISSGMDIALLLYGELKLGTLKAGSGWLLPTLQALEPEHGFIYKESDFHAVLKALTYLMGKMFLNGVGTLKDVRQAASFFDEAAGLGCERAAFHLGVLYELNAEPQKAFTCFKLAVDVDNPDAFANDPGALCRLGEFCLDFKCDVLMQCRAESYFRAAAQQGSAKGAYLFVKMFLPRATTTVKIQDWLESKINSAPVQNYQGMIYLLLKMAADGGIPEALCELGKFHLKGGKDYPINYDFMYSAGRNLLRLLNLAGEINLEQDDGLAEKYLRRAVDKGYLPAALELGKWYESRIPYFSYFFTGDDEKNSAIHYYRIAARGGIVEAEEALKRVDPLMEFSEPTKDSIQ